MQPITLLLVPHSHALSFWLILINAVVILLSMQTAGNPHATIFSLFFDGVSFRAAETHQVVLPILWFAYFFVPLLVLLNGLQQLWHTRTIHLRGLQIPPRKFAEVNLMLIRL
ncbi:Rhodopsin-like GPCR superfamily protein, partial [Lacticaseibacillus rhamnosus MTCC 5462]